MARPLQHTRTSAANIVACASEETQMALLVLCNRRHRHASPRQKLAQALRDFIHGRGGWITSPLPLADVALRFEVPSHCAAQISSELGALGLAVRFVSAGLQTGPSVVTELIREGHRIVSGRRVPAPCAVTTFEIALPHNNMAASNESAITAGRTAGVCTRSITSVRIRCSRAGFSRADSQGDQSRRDTSAT